MKTALGYCQDFFALFFPELCSACGKNLFKNELVICTNCIYNLPHTNFHNDKENKVAKQLWGRFPFEQATSFLYFQKGGLVQKAMHQLKYNHSPETGVKLGELYAHQLKRSENWIKPDLIIPVPLHPRKLKERGYNQSESIANGIGSVLDIDVNLSALLRTVNTTTQTKKSRFSRFENLEGAFIIKNPETLQAKHVLLVDDVVTTGATLEACSLTLLKVPGLLISVATIAFAE
ncbi:MAG: putative amidophosphoribosyltransferase [Sphingobacteriales bacterium]|nr:putative amidophosphoribosyltransferase [Sphingobacteriales bacterium]